jgi:predicted metal-dependent peptidase
LNDIIGIFANSKLIVYSADTTAYNPVEVDEDGVGCIDLVGAGGTDFKIPIENVLENNDPIALIYFTDGMCSSFPKPPSIPVLWVLTSRLEGWSPPFGETLYYEGENLQESCGA